jgi:hypothetical protein
MKTLEVVLLRIAAIVFGVFIGALATFIHFALVPYGLIVALVGSLACSFLVRGYTRSHLSVILFGLAWFVVVFRGATTSGEELLIMANTPGYTLLYLGPVLVLFPAILPKPKIKPEPAEPEVSELV